LGGVQTPGGQISSDFVSKKGWRRDKMKEVASECGNINEIRKKGRWANWKKIKFDRMN